MSESLKNGSQSHSYKEECILSGRGVDRYIKLRLNLCIPIGYCGGKWSYGAVCQPVSPG